jgi:hypothetical protein
MQKNQNKPDWLIVIYLTLAILMASCSQSPTPIMPITIKPTNLAVITDFPTATHQNIITPPVASTPLPTIMHTSTPDPSPSSSPGATYTASPTSTSVPTIAPTLTPTYAILRGTVLEQANCRYGPGAAYLYKYGLYPGNNIEIIGRNENGSWIVIQAIGGTNPCWVKASLLDIHGEVMTTAPTSLPLPQSPYYGPLKGVYATRDGDNVTISWNPLILRAGDDSLQYPYLVEAWLCQDGQLTFNAIGSWEASVTVQDEPGCTEPSYARVYGVEKHGYTKWVIIPWPVATK